MRGTSVCPPIQVVLTCGRYAVHKLLAKGMQTASDRRVMAFPDNLRRLRLDHFLSQAELARRSGVHALTITRLEAGRTAPSTRTVRALAQALGIAPSALASPEEVAEADRLHWRGSS